MKQSGHLKILVRKPELDAPSLQSMEGHLQTSMEVWVDNNNMTGVQLVFYLLLVSGPVSLLEVDVGSVPGGMWGGSCL